MDISQHTSNAQWVRGGGGWIRWLVSSREMESAAVGDFWLLNFVLSLFFFISLSVCINGDGAMIFLITFTHEGVRYELL